MDPQEKNVGSYRTTQIKMDDREKYRLVVCEPKQKNPFVSNRLTGQQVQSGISKRHTHSHTHRYIHTTIIVKGMLKCVWCGYNSST